MSAHVLVRYATAAGSTAGIADRIGDVIAAAGHVVSCGPVGAASGERCDALVLGSAVHDMAWLPDARAAAAAAAGTGIPVWCFSVGSVQPRGPLSRLLAREEARRVRAGLPADLAVRDHRVFGGILHLQGLPWWGRVFYRLVGGRAGDHRDWAAVERWAAGIAAELVSSPPDPASLPAT